MKGIIVRALSGNYYVDVGGQTVLCKARGKFRKERISPLPGDTVEVDTDQELITEVMPRKNYLVRPPIANLDKMFIVVATTDPEPSLTTTDKLIAVCEENNIEPVVLINKTDLKSPDELVDIYKTVGIEIICISAQNGDGCDKIKALIKDSICAFGGNSGVGKSSIIRSLHICDDAEIGETSNKIGRGKHTTKRVELFSAYGGYIADTPGFGDISYEECLKSEKGEIASLFREFSNYSGCRFDDCAHINEPECAIKAAAQRGEISDSRYQSYKMIYKESLERKKY